MWSSLMQGSNFKGAEQRSSVKKDKPKWVVKAVLKEIKKNKRDTLRITRVDFGGMDLINFQIWREDPDTGKSFPLKDQSLSFNADFREEVAKALLE